MIGICLLTSTTAFCTYLIGYYTKYFPGIFFVNYGIMGFADMVSMPFQALVVRINNNQMPKAITFSLCTVGFFSAMFLLISDAYPMMVPMGIFLIRLSIVGLENYKYHVMQELFPVEYHSLAAGTMNFVSRGFTAVALIVVEYTSQPVIFVLVLSVAVQFVMRGLIREPKTMG